MNLRPLRVLASALLLFSVLSQPALAQDKEKPKDLKIVRVTPEGEDVASTRQIVLQFNRPVVPLGQMDRTKEEVGVTITPDVDCQWRWLNTSALSCNLSDKAALVPATAYTLKVEPVIKAEDGASIEEPYEATFITERPRVSESFIRTWTAPGRPMFLLRLNQPVTKSSLQAHVYFEPKDGGDRFAIKAEKTEHDSSTDVKNNEEARAFWVITPAADLPLGKTMALKEEPGLVPFEGAEPGAQDSEIREFVTYPEFTMRGVYCLNKDGKEVFIKAGKEQEEDDLCNPLAPISLSFSAPVLRSQLKENLIFMPDLTGGKDGIDPWGSGSDWSRLYDERSDKDADYRVNLPFGLKAAQDYTLAVPARHLTLWEKIVGFFKGTKPVALTKLSDEFGRTIAPFSIKFATGHRNPNYEMAYRDAVLEKQTDSEVPLYVNNLENFSFDYNKLDAGGAAKGQTEKVILPEAQDVQFGVPAGIRGILNGSSGVIYATLNTTPPVKKYEGANKLFAQVTPYQVLAKIGHFQSVVWVTDLATGKPVEGANVTIHPGILTDLQPPSDIAAQIVTDANGLAILPGRDTLDPALSYMRNWRDNEPSLLVRVDKDGDMALLPLTNTYTVNLWQVASDLYEFNSEKFGHMKSWGMTAQGIYRAGDTMQYKIFVRDQDNERFIAPPAGTYNLEIFDPAGKSVQQQDSVTVSEFGTISGEYKIPENAPVGWYQFKLDAALEHDGATIAKEFYPLTVLVSDFTPSPFRVTAELNGDSFKPGDTLELTTGAALHSGGAFTDAGVRGTVMLRSRSFTSKNPNAKDYRFDSYKDEADSIDILQRDGTLDDKGEWKMSLLLPEEKIVYGQLVVEGSVRDDRGKSVAGVARADYTGVDRLVGLKPEEWVYQQGKPAIVKAIVVDDKGKPVPGTPIELSIQKEEVVAAKVKGAGNAYLNDNTVEWKNVGECKITSEESGKDCAFTPASAGTYRITATIADTLGRQHRTRETLWVTGSDYVQWNEDKEYALTILPEKEEYKVGETARYLVKNPYPGASALVTVERYGVIDSFVQTLDGSAPVIEIPVKADYVPGFYVSITAFSPRVDADVPPLGQIDLGKPAFRMGYVQTNVLDPYKAMKVSARSAENVYRPQDTVRVEITAKPLNMPETKEPVELAVAVLDESVFDLISSGSSAFDPYMGFYQLDSVDVTNYSLITRLLGRQKFEKKGANPGGDGGIDASMRNLFKYVSYWNPSVPVDENGHASIEFEAPDNLTGWRVLALAVTPNDRMGLGEATFKVNRPTEIRPVMPNQVREGDKFNAGFSIMNRTDKPRTIKVRIHAKGDIAKKDPVKEEDVTLEPYKRKTVLIPLEASLLPVTRDNAQGRITFSVTAGDDEDKDGVEHILPVLKTRTTETSATYGSTTDARVEQSVSIPSGIYTDTGDIGVVLSPSVIANLDGAFRYMRDYPYGCWEQKLTKAVMASHYTALKSYLDPKLEWKDAQTLPQDTLGLASSHQAPNGGMAYYLGKDEYADPYLSAYTALAFGWLRSAGYSVPLEVEERLHDYLLNFLRKDASPDYYQNGMTSTVRAVILSALKDTGKITQDDVIRFRENVKNMSLFGKIHYINAADYFPATREISAEVMQLVLSSGVESGGKFSFNDTVADGYAHILTTQLRDNCAALSGLLTYHDQSSVSALPEKLVRMVSQSRKQSDYWENTQENMFCLKAMVDYAAKYETVKPDMNVTASYDGKEFGKASFADLRDAPVTISRPLAEEDDGKNGKLAIDRTGDGRLYYTARLRYAPKNVKDSVNAGIDIRREYSLKQGGTWKLAQGPLTLKRGDLVKVDLFVSLPAARNFVVVNDPLPGGLETVNTDLATASTVDAGAAMFDSAGGSYWFRHDDWTGFGASRWSFYHKELRHDSARFYAEWLEPGNYHLSYMAQAVATGTFSAPPAKAEEMYDPDVYGLGAKGELTIEETP